MFEKLSAWELRSALLSQALDGIALAEAIVRICEILANIECDMGVEPDTSDDGFYDAVKDNPVEMPSQRNTSHYHE